MIHEQYELAAKLHGHKCPGLAIGVRAAVEARRLLSISDIQDKGLCCIAESMACYIDGIQALSGCTFGKGNLVFHPTGKTAFSFFNPAAGKSIRLVMRELDFSGDRAARTEYILTAPLEQIFTLTEPRVAPPPRSARAPKAVCAVCGESADEDRMTLIDGRLLCADCL